MKLISMTEKVLQLSKELGIGGDTFHDFYLKTTYYANFLSQPLTLGMFVPCVDNVPINKTYYPTSMSFSDEADKHFKEYSKAKENVLFEGFVQCDRNSNLDCLVLKRKLVFDDEHFLIDILTKGTIEDLVKYNLTLTQTAKNRILS